MSHDVKIAKTTLGEIRSMLVSGDIAPDLHLLEFASATAELPNESVVVIEINGQFVTYGVEFVER